ncbi:MAG TPA: hypothetical protein VMV43_07095, partial [Candidatus Nanopelagicaceae bacterium]|nr:hypothetical protein [Candidatus Nanopelagicaceae bacterium]
MGKNKNKIEWSSEISEDGIEFTQPDIMLKLISTIDERGWPHVTLIASNRAISKDKIVWGAFT